jgi:hypothetical protein
MAGDVIAGPTPATPDSPTVGAPSNDGRSPLSSRWAFDEFADAGFVAVADPVQVARAARSWSCSERTAAGRRAGESAARSSSRRRRISVQRRERTVGRRRSAVCAAGTARSRLPAAMWARDNNAALNTARGFVVAGSVAVRPRAVSASSSRRRQSREETPARVSASWARPLSRRLGPYQVR